VRIKFVLVLAAACVLAGSRFASAEAASKFDWSGFYYGGHFGGSLDEDATGIVGNTTALAVLVKNGIIPSSVTSNPTGPLAGLQLGYNVQHGKIVYGVEADLSLAAIQGKSTTTTFGFAPSATYTTTVNQNLQWFSTLRGRLGFAETNNLLIYGTGGLALGWSSYSANVHRNATLLKYDIPASANLVKAGWTVGFGAEYAMKEHWSFKAEYLYYDLGKESLTGNVTITGIATPPQLGYMFVTRGSMLRLGLNRKFN
jgi:opacity protein-like surface antigen